MVPPGDFEVVPYQMSAIFKDEFRVPVSAFRVLGFKAQCSRFKVLEFNVQSITWYSAYCDCLLPTGVPGTWVQRSMFNVQSVSSTSANCLKPTANSVKRAPLCFMAVNCLLQTVLRTSYLVPRTFIRHSVLKLFTGFAIAAFSDWKLTVTIVIPNAMQPASRKTHQRIVI